MQPPYTPNTVNQTVDYGGRKWQGQPGGEWTDITQQTQQQDALNNATNTLKSQSGSLSDQYQQLLQATLGQGTVAMNTATTGENNYLGQRGLLSNTGVGANQLSQAQLAVQQANQSAVGSLGYTEAQLQAGLAGSIATLPLNYGSLALSQSVLPSQIFANQAQGSSALTGSRYISIPNVGVYDTQTGKIVSSTGLGNTGQTIVSTY